MNKNKSLHIICHDIPFPPDYGGVMDLYYKIKTLSAKGIAIKLHCFYHKRSPAGDLDKFCQSVHYYRRTTGMAALSLNTPYIVESRHSRELLKNLLQDEDPILMEGIHCTKFTNVLYKTRKIFLRLHNVEHVYYKYLGDSEKNIAKKLFFISESNKLKKYEQFLPADLPIFAVATQDMEYYLGTLNKKNTRHLPVFIPFHKVESEPGLGKFCLYHGNLSVPENEKAALWLIKMVFSKLDIPFIIAGKLPGRRLVQETEKFKNIRILPDPADHELNELIRNAHIHVLPSFNRTGIKLKLIHAIYKGRHCIVNEEAEKGSGLGPACHICNGAGSFIEVIKELIEKPFTAEDIQLRKKIAENIFNNEKNADQLIQWIW